MDKESREKFIEVNKELMNNFHGTYKPYIARKNKQAIGLCIQLANEYFSEKKAAESICALTKYYEQQKTTITDENLLYKVQSICEDLMDVISLEEEKDPKYTSIEYRRYYGILRYISKEVK